MVWELFHVFGDCSTYLGLLRVFGDCSLSIVLGTALCVAISKCLAKIGVLNGQSDAVDKAAANSNIGLSQLSVPRVSLQRDCTI